MIHLIMGLIFLVLGAWGIITWWYDFGLVLRGLFPLLLVLLGLAAVGAGFQKTINGPEHDEADVGEVSTGTFIRPEEGYASARRKSMEEAMSMGKSHGRTNGGGEKRSPETRA
jgi:hypothetical protein